MNSSFKVSLLVLSILLVAFLALGCQKVPLALGAGVRASAASPNVSPSDSAGSAQQIEFNGVIVTIPAGWQVVNSSDGDSQVVRLIYTNDKSGKGPWIELAPVATPLDSNSPATTTPAASGSLVFPGSAINTSGQVITYTYIPGKNVMLCAGYETSAQHDMVLKIISGIQYANP